MKPEVRARLERQEIDESKPGLGQHVSVEGCKRFVSVEKRGMRVLEEQVERVGFPEAVDHKMCEVRVYVGPRA